MTELRQYVARAQVMTHSKKTIGTRCGDVGSLFVLAHSVEDAVGQVAAFKFFGGGFAESDGGSFFHVVSIAPHVPELHGAFMSPGLSHSGGRVGLELEEALRKAAMFFWPDVKP